MELGKTLRDQLVVLDEYHETDSHVEDAIAWLEESGKPRGTIHSEHEPAHIDKLDAAGYTTEPAPKDIDAGIAEVRKRLEVDGNLEIPNEAKVIVAMGGVSDGSYLSWAHEPEESATDSGEGVVGLVISKRCEHLIREFFSYKPDHVDGPLPWIAVSTRCGTHVWALPTANPGGGSPRSCRRAPRLPVQDHQSWSR